MVTGGREDHFWARFCFSPSGCALFFSWVESTLLRRASFSGWGKAKKTRKMKNRGTSFSLSNVPRALPFPHLPRLRALTFKPLDLPIFQQRVQKKEAFVEEKGSRACARFFKHQKYNNSRKHLLDFFPFSRFFSSAVFSVQDLCLEIAQPHCACMF